MLKKTITYTDLDGKPVTEDFYFHLTKADIAEMELSEKEGMEKRIRKIVEEQNGREIIRFFKEILHKAYGVRSEDGRRFVRSDELSDGFMQTDAYSELFISLVTDANAAAEFIKGIVPADLAEKVQTAELPSGEDDRPEWLKAGRAPTDEEFKKSDPKWYPEAFRLKS